MLMKRIQAAGLLCFLPGVSIAAPALNIESFESECREQIMAKQCPAGENCYGLWKPIVKCAFLRALDDRVAPSALDTCIAEVDDERKREHLCTACGDAEIIPKVLACLSE